MASNISTLAQANPDVNQFNFYIQKAQKAIANNDLFFACDLYKEALEYPQGIDAKTFQTTKQTAKKICDQILNQSLQQFNNYLNRPECVAYRNAKQQCATASDVRKCLQVKGFRDIPDC
jgi:hypothetical protein